MDDDACPICLESYGSDFVTTNCSHKFHSSCLGDWIMRNPTCPICRNNIISVNDDMISNVNAVNNVDNVDNRNDRNNRNSRNANVVMDRLWWSNFKKKINNIVKWVMVIMLIMIAILVASYICNKSVLLGIFIFMICTNIPIFYVCGFIGIILVYLIKK